MTSCVARPAHAPRPASRPRSAPRRSRRRGGAGPPDGGDEGDVGAPAGGHLGDRVALLARRAVGDDAHRVDRLPGAAGGDQHPHARRGRWACRRRRARRLGRGHDVGGIGEPSLADVAAGEATGLGVDHVHAAPAQRGEVLLHRGVLPHLGVHRRRHQHRGAGREQRGGEQVVGDPGRVLARAPWRWPGATITRSAVWPSRVCGIGSGAVEQRRAGGFRRRARRT